MQIAQFGKFGYPMSAKKKPAPAPAYTPTDPVEKFFLWVKDLVSQLFNIDKTEQAKQKLAAEDEFLRHLVADEEPVLLSWTSVGKIKVNGKAGTATRKWLLLWSNGNISFVNRGTTRSPENAISSTGKNIKPVTNATAAVKSVSFEKYNMILQGVQDNKIEITLDPKTKPNLETAKKFATKLKKFI